MRMINFNNFFTSHGILSLSLKVAALSGSTWRPPRQGGVDSKAE